MVGWRTFFRLLGGNVATLATEKAPTYNDSRQIDSHDHHSHRRLRSRGLPSPRQITGRIEVTPARLDVSVCDTESFSTIGMTD